MNKLVFEYTDDFGYRTLVVKEYESSEYANQLDQIISEMKSFLLACGFSPKGIEECFEPDF